jgi:hypothetical protein
VDRATLRVRTGISAAALALCTGLTALLCEDFQLTQPFVERTHVLFCIVTFAAISTVLITGARHLADQPALELYRYTRWVSHWVYILIYALGIVRVCLYLFDLNRQTQIWQSTALATVRAPDDFQFYVFCCILPLWSVRALVLAVPPKNWGLPARHSVTESVGR